MTLTFDLRTPKCIQLFYKSLSTNWPNMREIRWKMAEKSQNAVSGKEKKIKKKINNKEKTIQQQKGLPTLSADLYKEKTIQQQKGLPTLSADLNERAMAGNSNHKYQFNSKITRLQCIKDGYQMRTGLEAEWEGLRVRTWFFFFFLAFWLQQSEGNLLWLCYFLELNL